MFLNAFRYVARDVADAHAIIVGDGQERRRLEAQAVSQGLGGRVHFVGYTATPGDYLAGRHRGHLAVPVRRNSECRPRGDGPGEAWQRRLAALQK